MYSMYSQIREKIPFTIRLGNIASFNVNTSLSVSCVDQVTQRQFCSIVTFEIVDIGSLIKGDGFNFTTSSSRAKFEISSNQPDAYYNDTANIDMGVLYNSCKQTLELILNINCQIYYLEIFF